MIRILSKKQRQRRPIFSRFMKNKAFKVMDKRREKVKWICKVRAQRERKGSARKDVAYGLKKERRKKHKQWALIRRLSFHSRTPSFLPQIGTERGVYVLAEGCEKKRKKDNLRAGGFVRVIFHISVTCEWRVRRSCSGLSSFVLYCPGNVSLFFFFFVSKV